MTENKVSIFEIYREAAGVVLRSSHFWHLFILGVLLIYCILFYYFGELVSLLRWESLRLDFLYGAHDAQRILFLAPIVYAGYVLGKRASIIVTVVATVTIIPRFIVVSDGVDPLWRIIMFIVVAGAIGLCISMVTRNTFRH